MYVFAVFFFKPSDGLEPSTPSLPWRIQVHAAGRGGALPRLVFLLLCRFASLGRDDVDPPGSTPERANMSPEDLPDSWRHWASSGRPGVRCMDSKVVVAPDHVDPVARWMSIGSSDLSLTCCLDRRDDRWLIGRGRHCDGVWRPSGAPDEDRRCSGELAVINGENDALRDDTCERSAGTRCSRSSALPFAMRWGSSAKWPRAVEGLSASGGRSSGLHRDLHVAARHHGRERRAPRHPA